MDMRMRRHPPTTVGFDDWRGHRVAPPTTVMAQPHQSRYGGGGHLSHMEMGQHYNHHAPPPPSHPIREMPSESSPPDCLNDDDFDSSKTAAKNDKPVTVLRLYKTKICKNWKV